LQILQKLSKWKESCWGIYEGAKLGGNEKRSKKSPKRAGN
jgi:hypothetical protein